MVFLVHETCMNGKLNYNKITDCFGFVWHCRVGLVTAQPQCERSCYNQNVCYFSKKSIDMDLQSAAIFGRSVNKTICPLTFSPALHQSVYRKPTDGTGYARELIGIRMRHVHVNQNSKDRANMNTKCCICTVSQCQFKFATHYFWSVCNLQRITGFLNMVKSLLHWLRQHLFDHKVGIDLMATRDSKAYSGGLEGCRTC